MRTRTRIQLILHSVKNKDVRWPSSDPFDLQIIRSRTGLFLKCVTLPDEVITKAIVLASRSRDLISR